MASNFIPHICGKSKIYIPEAGCDDCSRFEARLSAVEEILEKKVRISQTDRMGNSISVEVLGEVVE